MPYSVAHPAGDLFPPLLADVKEPQTSLSIVRVNTGSNHINAALASIGGDFGFYRWRRNAGAPEWQLGIFAGVLSQCNLDTPSKDLVNTDYLVGLPLSFRSGTYSGRLRVFHQSSHLGMNPYWPAPYQSALMSTTRQSTCCSPEISPLGAPTPALNMVCAAPPRI